MALLFRFDRGLCFVDRPGAGPDSATIPVLGPEGLQLTYSPGRIEPTNAAWSNSRKPLAGEFRYNGQTLFVIANHFNSKGGDDPLFGRFQPPVLNTEAQRREQAQVERDFISALLALDPQARVVALGDLNDFEFSPPLGILKGTDMTALVETLPRGSATPTSSTATPRPSTTPWSAPPSWRRSSPTTSCTSTPSTCSGRATTTPR